MLIICRGCQVQLHINQMILTGMPQKQDSPQRGEQHAAVSRFSFSLVTCSQLLFRLNSPARRGADKGARACGTRDAPVAALETRTTILIVLARRPTFPVGTRMAVLLLRRLRAECVARAKARRPCTLPPPPFSIFGRESMKSERAGAAMATAAYVNRQSRICEDITGCLVSGQLFSLLSVLLCRDTFSDTKPQETRL